MPCRLFILITDLKHLSDVHVIKDCIGETKARSDDDDGELKEKGKDDNGRPRFILGLLAILQTKPDLNHCWAARYRDGITAAPFLHLSRFLRWIMNLPLFHDHRLPKRAVSNKKGRKQENNNSSNIWKRNVARSSISIFVQNFSLKTIFSRDKALCWKHSRQNSIQTSCFIQYYPHVECIPIAC